MQGNQVYQVNRPIYSFEGLSNVYKEENLSFNLIKSIKQKATVRKPSAMSVMQYIFPFPFIMASFYSYKFILYDLMAGMTMAVFHIPQGMAYGLLASLQPINGLYTSFFPPLIYFLFGTSRHLSIGTFSIMSLLSSVPVIREAKIDMGNLTNATSGFSGTAGYEKSKLEISIATTLLAGIIQVAMGFFHMGCIMAYISDALIGGFTCSTCLHVIMSQMSAMLGIPVKRYSGLGELPYKIFLFAQKIKGIHWITVGISVSCIAILLIFTEIINPRVQKRFKVTIPIQLLVVVLATIISYYASFNKRFNVVVVGPIPKGLPMPLVPNIRIWPTIFIDAFLLALLGFVMNSAISKIYALKLGYSIEYNQECVAFGLANVFGSFFQCTMSAGALARTAVVVQVGMKSQLASLISCICMLFVLLFIGPLFEHVPNCALSAIVVVSLKGMIMQITILPQLYRLSKYDFNTWIITFIATISLNIPYGLVVGFLFSLLTIVARVQNPSSQILGQLPNTNIYHNIKEYKDAKELPGIKIFRFNAPFYFGNAEYFQSRLYEKSGVDPQKLKTLTIAPRKNKTGADLEKDPVQSKESSNEVEILMHNYYAKDEIKCEPEIKHIIIDCSSVNYVDDVAIRILEDVYTSYRNVGVSLYLAGPNYKVRKMLAKANLAKENLSRMMFVTIHDAVLSISVNSECLEKF